MVCRARFSARSPPRLSRCRTVRPLLAGSGLVPPRAANAASLRQRPGGRSDTMAWAALTGPTPRARSARGPGRRRWPAARRGWRLERAARPRARPGRGGGSRRAARPARGWRRGGGRRRARVGQAWSSVSAPRASVAVGVVAAQQQRAQPVGLCGAGGGELLAGAQQDPQRLAVAVRARGGQPVGVQAQRGQHGQVGVDRVGLAAAAAGLAVSVARTRCTSSPAAATARASPMP